MCPAPVHLLPRASVSTLRLINTQSKREGRRYRLMAERHVKELHVCAVVLKCLCVAKKAIRTESKVVKGRRKCFTGKRRKRVWRAAVSLCHSPRVQSPTIAV